MSILTWDGLTLAADRQATSAGMRLTCTKLRRLSTGAVIGVCGDADYGLGFMAWYERGALPSEWPRSQIHEKDWAQLIVFEPKDGLVVYQRDPVAMPVEDKFMAWGSGRDYAMGAMASGKGAVAAVRIACRFDSQCGMGVSSFRCTPWRKP